MVRKSTWQLFHFLETSRNGIACVVLRPDSFGASNGRVPHARMQYQMVARRSKALNPGGLRSLPGLSDSLERWTRGQYLEKEPHHTMRSMTAKTLFMTQSP